MLPDFPAVKHRADRELTRYLKGEIVRRSPILGEVSHIRQHEGQNWSYGEKGKERPGGGYQKLGAELTLTREEMQEPNLKTVFKKYDQMAEKLAETQTKDMFNKISEAAESVGNIIDAGGKLSQDHILELLSKVQTDFDPETKKPINAIFVMHPDLAKKVIPQMKEWEDDSAFQKRLAEVNEKQWIAWRDRESRRRLAD